MTDTKPNNKVRTSISLDKQVLDGLQKFADNEKTSVSAVVQQLGDTFLKSLAATPPEGV